MIERYYRRTLIKRPSISVEIRGILFQASAEKYTQLSLIDYNRDTSKQNRECADVDVVELAMHCLNKAATKLRRMVSR